MASATIGMTKMNRIVTMVERGGDGIILLVGVTVMVTCGRRMGLEGRNDNLVKRLPAYRGSAMGPVTLQDSGTRTIQVLLPSMASLKWSDLRFSRV